jgi:hypothetical protein
MTGDAFRSPFFITITACLSLLSLLVRKAILFVVPGPDPGTGSEPHCIIRFYQIVIQAGPSPQNIKGSSRVSNKGASVCGESQLEIHPLSQPPMMLEL